MNPIEELIAPDIEQFERDTGIPYRTAFLQNDDGSLNHVVMLADFRMPERAEFSA